MYLKYILIKNIIEIFQLTSDDVAPSTSYFFTASPPLPPEEIISVHKIEISDAVQITCAFVCQREPRCVGFNYRAAVSIENCQLTNVTKKRKTTNRGNWTLLRDIEGVCLFILLRTLNFRK